MPWSAFLVPIPAFFFLSSLNLLTRMAELSLSSSALSPPGIALIALVLGPLPILHRVNDTIITTALLILVFSLVRAQGRGLSGLLQHTADLPFAEVADHILTTIEHWQVAQNDDLTVLVCDYIV